MLSVEVAKISESCLWVGQSVFPATLTETADPSSGCLLDAEMSGKIL